MQGLTIYQMLTDGHNGQPVFTLQTLTCKYLSCSADGDSSITLEASRNAFEARFSPSAAITLALASREASASAAIARCNCSGSRASFL